MFVLPAGFRPLSGRLFSSIYSKQFHYLDIRSLVFLIFFVLPVFRHEIAPYIALRSTQLNSKGAVLRHLEALEPTTQILLFCRVPLLQLFTCNAGIYGCHSDMLPPLNEV